MMEKQNRICEKRAAGDAGDIDDLVEGAAKGLAKPNAPVRRSLRGESAAGVPDPAPVLAR